MSSTHYTPPHINFSFNQQAKKRTSKILSVTKVSFGVFFCLFSHHQASGDIRNNGDRYIYHIQLSGITNNSLPKCLGANICQVKQNDTYSRKIGSSNKAKYYIKGKQKRILIYHSKPFAKHVIGNDISAKKKKTHTCIRNKVPFHFSMSPSI